MRTTKLLCLAVISFVAHAATPAQATMDLESQLDLIDRNLPAVQAALSRCFTKPGAPDGNQPFIEVQLTVDATGKIVNAKALKEQTNDRGASPCILKQLPALLAGQFQTPGAIGTPKYIVRGPAPIRAATPTHCSGKEETLFSCLIPAKGKVVSLCAGPSLKYRFGKVGLVELEYPAASEAGGFTYQGHTEGFGHGGSSSQASVQFHTSEATFEVHLSSEEGQGQAMGSAGIRVTTSKGKVVEFECDSNWTFPDIEKLEKAAKR